MKKKLVAFLVLIVAICCLFTACVTPEPSAADALMRNDEKVTGTTRISVDNAKDDIDFTDEFSVAAGFDFDVYVYGQDTAVEDKTNVALNEGENKFRLNVFYKSNASNNEDFTVIVTREESFEVSFQKVLNGEAIAGDFLPKEDVVDGDTYTLPGAPTLGLGEEFVGWYKNPACTVSAGSSIVVTADTKLYAKVVYKNYTMEAPAATIANDGYVFNVGETFAFAPTAEITWSMEISPYYNVENLVVKANGVSIANLYSRDRGAMSENIVMSSARTLQDYVEAGVDVSSGTITFTVEGLAPNVYTMTAPTSSLANDGYVLTVDDSFTYGGQLVVAIEISSDYDYSAMQVKANGVDVSALFALNRQNTSAIEFISTQVLEAYVAEGVNLYNESADAIGIEFTVEGLEFAEKPLTVASGAGYTSTVSAAKVKVGEEYTVTVTIADHFEGTAVLSLNGAPVQASASGKTYTYVGVMGKEGANFTVSGIVATEYTVTLVTDEIAPEVLAACPVELDVTKGNYDDEYTVTVTIAEGYRKNIDGFQIFVDGYSVRHDIENLGSYVYAYTGTITGNVVVEVVGIKADGTTYVVTHYAENPSGGVIFEGVQYSLSKSDSPLFVEDGDELDQDKIDSKKIELGGYTFYKADVQGTTINYYYNRNSYLIKFLDYNGSEISSKTYKHNTAIEIPKDPSRAAEDEGEVIYTFAGWAVEGSDDVVEVSPVATEAVTYVAQYTSKNKVYSFTLPAVAEQIGYTLTADVTEGELNEEFVLTLVLDAEYNKTPAVVKMNGNEIEFVDNKYTGTFGEGLGAVTVEVTQNTYTVTLPAEEDRVGYTLTVPTTSGFTGTTIAFTFTLAPGYEECIADVVVAVDGQKQSLSASGEGSFTLTKDCVITVTGVQANLKEYTIIHQQQAANGNYAGRKDTTFVEFRGDIDDATVLEQAIEYEGFEAPVIAERNGDEIVLQYARKVYDVVFNDYNGTELKNYDVRYDVAIVAPAEPTRVDEDETYYEFAGWSDGENVYSTAQVNAIKASKSVTFTATFTAKTREYTITLSSGAGYTLTEKNNKLTGTKAETYTLVITLDAEYTETAPTMTVGGQVVELTKNSATEYEYTANYATAEVKVTAVQNVYTASYEAVTGANVVVTPASGVKGTAYTVTVSVLAGYQENFDKVSVTVDGSAATANASAYTFTYSGVYNADVQIVVAGVEQDATNIVVQIYTQNKELNGYEMTSSEIYEDEDKNFDAADIAAVEAITVEGFTIDTSKSVNNAASSKTYAIYFNRNDITVTYDVKGTKTTETVKYGLTVASVPATDSYEEGETVYTFKEWQVNGSAFAIDTAITEAVELVAVYDSKVKTYQIVVSEGEGFTVWDADTYEPFDREVKLGENIAFEIIMDEDGDYSLPTQVKVGTEVVEPDDGLFYIIDVVAEHIIDGKIVITVEGVKLNTYTVTLPAEAQQVGYTITQTATGNTKGSIVTLLVSKNGDYDISAMKVKANGVELIPGEPGEYQFTLNENTVVTVEEVRINTYTVEGTKGAGYTITDIKTTDESGLFVKGATVIFKVNVDADYNRSNPAVRFGITGSTATSLATKTGEGEYSIVIEGNTTISVTGLTQNVYTITGSPKVVNTTVPYTLLNSLTGANLYINDVKKTTTSYLNLTVESGVATTIVYKANDGTVLYSNTVTIEAGGENVNLENIYLGYYNLENFTAKADGQYSNPEATTDGWLDKVNGNFIAEYTVHTDNSAEKKAEVEAKTYEKENADTGEVETLPKGLEEDPCYGFSINSPTAGQWIQLMFHKAGIRIITHEGWNKRFETTEVLLNNEVLNVAADGGLTIKMVRYGNYVYMYAEDELIFAVSSVDGLTVVKNANVTVESSVNNLIKSVLAATLNQTDVRYSIVATLDAGSGKELHNRVTDFYYADAQDGVDTSYVRNFGTIVFEDGYDGTATSGGSYMILWPNAANESAYEDVNDYQDVTEYYMQDLADYAGVLDNRTIKVKFTSNNASKNFELSKAFLYKRAKGDDGEWTAIGDIYATCTYDANKNYYYTMSIENGYDYKFDLDYANAAAQTAVTGIIRLKGSYQAGLFYEIYTRTIDGEQGVLVHSGETTIGTDPNDASKTVLFAKYVKAGAYKFVLHGGAKAYGVVYDFDISGDQAQSGQDNKTTVSLGEFDLEENVFGDNITGTVTAEFNTTSRENYTVTLTGVAPFSSYVLAQDLGDGEMISYSMKFNALERAHGLYGATGDSYYNADGIDCDAYYKNAIDKATYLTNAPHESKEEPQRSSFLGLKATGEVLIYSYGDSIKPSPFVDIVDQFAIAQNYNLTYDLAYYRVRENGIPYVYLLAKYGTDSTYTVMGRHEAGFTVDANGKKTYTERSTLELAISGISGFYQNYSYRDLVWRTDTEENAKIFAAAMAANVPTGPVSKGVNEEGETVYEATLLGNGGAYIGDVVGDKTKGVFTIEADVESYVVHTKDAYNVYGLALVDPVTGKRVHMGIPGNTANKWVYMSLSTTGNGWETRPSVPSLGAISTDSEAYVNYNYDATNATTKAKHYVKAVIKGDYWKLYAGAAAENAVLVYEGNVLDVFKTSTTNEGKNNWDNGNGAKYPTANVVAVGLYTFGDGTNYARYYNVKAKYETNVDLEKPAIVEEVLAYAQDKGVLMDEDSDYIVAIKNAITEDDLAEAKQNAIDYIDFISYKNAQLDELYTWIAADHEGYGTKFDLAVVDEEAVKNAANKDEVDAAVAVAKCNAAIVAAKVDYQLWYLSLDADIADAIAAGTLTQQELNAARANADALIESSTAFEEVLVNFEAAKNIVSGLLDSGINAAKNAAYAEIDAVSATTTEYGEAELADAKAKAKIEIGRLASADEVNAAKADIVAGVEAVAQKVSTVFATVNFTVDGVTVSTMTNVTYGAAITVADATKASDAQYDYSFKAWAVDGKETANVIADTIAATFTNTTKSYDITVVNGTGYTVVADKSNALYGTEITVTVTLERAYSQSVPTVSYASGKTAELDTKEGRVLTYKFTLTGAANVTVSGVVANTYELNLNTYIIRGQSFSAVTATAQVDIYVNETKMKSNVANGVATFDLGIGDHLIEYKVGSTVVYKTSVGFTEGDPDANVDAFVGYNHLLGTTYTMDAEGIHNNPTFESSPSFTDIDGANLTVAAGEDFVATAKFVDDPKSTEGDQGHGFTLYTGEGATTMQLYIRWIRKGFRIEYKGSTWDTRIAEEENVYRSSSLQNNNGTLHTIALIRYNKVIYLIHDGVIEAKIGGTNGFIGVTNSSALSDATVAANTTVATIATTLANEAITGIKTVVNFNKDKGAVQYTTYKDLGMGSGSAATSYILNILKTNVDDFVATEVNNVISGYTYTPTTSDLAAITSPTAHLDAAVTTAKNAIMTNAVAAFKTKAIAEVKSYAGGTIADSFLTDINNATTVKALNTGIQNAKKLVDASVTVSGKVTAKDGGAAISGATVAITVGTATFTTTTNSSGNYSVLIGCGAATVQVSASGYISAAVPVEFNTTGTATQNIVLAQNYFATQTYITVGSTKKADASDYLDVTYDAYHTSNISLLTGDILTDGSYITLRYVYNGDSEGKQAHGTLISGEKASINTFIKHTVGGVGYTMNTGGRIVTGSWMPPTWVSGDATEVHPVFDSNSLAAHRYGKDGYAATADNNARYVYEIAFARIGTMVYQLGRWAGTDSYAVMAQGDISVNGYTTTKAAPINFYFAGEGGFRFNMSFSNVGFFSSGASTLVNSAWDYAQIRTAYAGMGRHDKEAGDQYHKYDMYLNLTGTANSEAAFQIAPDASFNLTAGGTLTVTSDVYAQFSSTTKDYEGFGFTLYSNGNSTSTGHKYTRFMIKGYQKLTIMTGGGNGWSGGRINDVVKKSNTSDDTITDDYGIYFVKNSVMPSTKGAVINGTMKMVAEGTVVTLYWNDTAFFKADINVMINGNANGNNYPFDNGADNAKANMTDLTKAYVGATMYHDDPNAAARAIFKNFTMTYTA